MSFNLPLIDPLMDFSLHSKFLITEACCLVVQLSEKQVSHITFKKASVGMSVLGRGNIEYQNEGNIQHQF